jgi:hypothetical protein
MMLQSGGPKSRTAERAVPAVFDPVSMIGKVAGQSPESFHFDTATFHFDMVFHAAHFTGLQPPAGKRRPVAVLRQQHYFFQNRHAIR